MKCVGGFDVWNGWCIGALCVKIGLCRSSRCHRAPPTQLRSACVSAVYLLAKFMRRLTVKRRQRNKQTKKITNNKKRTKRPLASSAMGHWGTCPPPPELGHVEKFGSFNVTVLMDYNRCLALKWPCHFMGNQVWNFVIFLYVYIPVMYACFCAHFCRASTGWKILVTPLKETNGRRPGVEFGAS